MLEATYLSLLFLGVLAVAAVAAAVVVRVFRGRR
jgi:hypothetical protein